ncbi:MAG: hypothetical protein ACLUZ0_09260 [Coprococcus sp.]
MNREIERAMENIEGISRACCILMRKIKTAWLYGRNGEKNCII